MTFDLCFVPAQLYRRHFYLLKGLHNQSLTRTRHFMVSAVENYASHCDSQVKQNARTEDIRGLWRKKTRQLSTEEVLHENQGYYTFIGKRKTTTKVTL